MVRLAGAVKEAPLVGETMETVGGTSAGAGVDLCQEKPPPAPPHDVNWTST